MKTLVRGKYLTAFAFLFFTLNSLNAQKGVSPFLPETFAEYANVRDFTISPEDGNIYFTLDSFKSEIGSIAYISKNENGWSKPQIVSFSGRYRDLEPAFSVDGKTLFFASNRPIHSDSIAPKDYNIWYVTRTETGWSDPIAMDESINSEHNEFYPSLAANGNLYFTSDRPSDIGRENIYLSKFENGTYAAPVALDENINSSFYEFNAFVAPDESFLVFSAIRRGEGLGGGDLYISFNKDGWQKAQPLQLVNTKFLDFCPFVDAKTGTLYYTSQFSEIPDFADKTLEASYYKSLTTSTEPKGLNRIYKIALEKALPE